MESVPGHHFAINKIPCDTYSCDQLGVSRPVRLSSIPRYLFVHVTKYNTGSLLISSTGKHNLCYARMGYPEAQIQVSNVGDMLDMQYCGMHFF